MSDSKLNKNDEKLFRPIRVGNVELTHRIVLAPLARLRTDEAHVTTDLVAEYYAQRASVPGTLLISEATAIAPKAGGFPNAAGIWNEEQILGWKKVRTTPAFSLLIEVNRTAN